MHVMVRAWHFKEKCSDDLNASSGQFDPSCSSCSSWWDAASLHGERSCIGAL